MMSSYEVYVFDHANRKLGTVKFYFRCNRRTLYIELLCDFYNHVLQPNDYILGEKLVYEDSLNEKK